jgi:nicotinate-nucleotide adenylyltransferase
LREVGVYGGTFNPIHVGHLRAAEEVAETLGLARVLFVPSAVPPHKLEDGGEVIAPGAQRLAWVRLAIADNPRFAADAIEVERGGASYLVDTLHALRDRLRAAGEQPVFLVGSDAFAEMGAWRAPRELFGLAHFAVILRPPQRAGGLAEWLPAEMRDLVEIAPDGRSGRHRSAGTWLRLVEIAGFDVSASDLRRRLREGRSVRYLLPEAVRAAVQASGVYREAPVGTGPRAGGGSEPAAETAEAGGSAGVRASR